MPTLPKHCGVCGQFFTVTAKSNTTRIKYCSPKCSKIANGYKKRGTYEKECKVCGTKFKTIYSIQRYCSAGCQKKVGHHSYVEAKGLIKKECKFCRTTFETTSKAKKYCGTHCYKLAKKQRDKDFMFNKKLKEKDIL